jgi:hypothetical protein
MYQGLSFILALPALWLIALEVYVRYNPGILEGALGLRQCNGDAECNGSVCITCVGGADTGNGQPCYRSTFTEDGIVKGRL